MDKALIKTSYNKFKEILKKFVYSDFFVWLIGAHVFLCWLTDYWVVGLVEMCVVFALILIFCKDTLPSIPLLWMFLFIFSLNIHKLDIYAPLLSCIILLVFGFIVNILRFKPKMNFLAPKNIKTVIIAFFIFGLSIILGGISRADRDIYAVLGIVALVVIIFAGYLFYTATIDGRDGKRMLRYVILIMFVSGLIISAQILTYYIRLNDIQKVIYSFQHKTVNLGWGGTNNYSIMLALCLPASIYYSIKSKNLAFFYVIIAVCEFFLICLSQSRGAILFTALLMPFIVGYQIVKAKSKFQIIFVLAVVVDLLIIFGAYYGKEIVDIVQVMFDKGLDSSGRDELYIDALNLFKQKPIFGWGFDYRLGELARDKYTPYWYHSSVFQALASLGVFGIIAFAYWEWSRYKTFLYNINPMKLTILVGMLIYDLYSLIDTGYYTPNTVIIFVIMLLASQKALENNQGGCSILRYMSLKRYVRKNKGLLFNPNDVK